MFYSILLSVVEILNDLFREQNYLRLWNGTFWLFLNNNHLRFSCQITTFTRNQKSNHTSFCLLRKQSWQSDLCTERIWIATLVAVTFVVFYMLHVRGRFFWRHQNKIAPQKLTCERSKNTSKIQMIFINQNHLQTALLFNSYKVIFLAQKYRYVIQFKSDTFGTFLWKSK